MTTRADKFRQAAITYVGVGVIVIILTLIAGTSPTRGTPPLVGLFIGVGFVGLFGALIFCYGWVRCGWARKSIVALTSLFVATNALRTLQYLLNFLGYRLEVNFQRVQYFINLLGYHLEINLRQPSLALHPSEFTFPILFLINTLLMGFITYMLARAAWDL